MSPRFRTAAALAASAAFLIAGRTFAEPTEATPRGATKEGTFSGQLLLPLYLVDTTQPDGPTTLYGIRNELTTDVDVVVRYYGADRPDLPQDEQTITLGRKAIRTVNIRNVVQPLDLQIDPDGFARGYVTFTTDEGEIAIHGDYFQINDAENFASGARLVNIDPNSNGNDLCNRFSMRFLDSALIFDSGTVFNVWIQTEEPQAGTAFSYSVYSQAGGDAQLTDNFVSSDVTFQVSANLLMSGPLDLEFGAIEFEFPGGIVGHVSAMMSAFERYSVGFEATCLDPT